MCDNVRQRLTMSDSHPPVLRTFAVAKVLPLGLTDKKRFIARRSLKRTFASC